MNANVLGNAGLVFTYVGFLTTVVCTFIPKTGASSAVFFAFNILLETVGLALLFAAASWKEKP